MCKTINAIEPCMDISDCMREEEIRVTTLDDEHLGIQSENVPSGLLSMKTEVQKEP